MPDQHEHPRKDTRMSATHRAAMLRPFAEFLSVIDRGKVCDELAGHLAEVTEAVIELDKPGTLTLKLTVKPRKGQAGTVDVTAASSASPPKPDHAGVFFFDESFQLSRDDPTMQPMITYDEATKLGENL